MTLPAIHLGLVGCGSMGSALLRGWIKAGLSQATIITPHQDSVAPFRKEIQVNWYESAQDLSCDVLIFAVKPEVLEEVLIQYRPFMRPNMLVVSVVTGKKIGFYQEQLGGDVPFLRVMPNLPVAFGQGMTVAMAANTLDKQHIKIADQLFSSIGELAWINDESLFDGVTAVSGCGPAYIYLLVESLIAAGQQVGLSKELAEKSARQTMIGAGVLLAQLSESAQTLKHKVTSPGGATEAALKVLEPDFQDLMSQAVASAAKRSRELST